MIGHIKNLISLIYGNSNSLEYKLQNESLINNPIIKVDFEEISYKLTEHFIKNPEAIYNLEPRKYERVYCIPFRKTRI